jgi:hypothetical protein
VGLSVMVVKVVQSEPAPLLKVGERLKAKSGSSQSVWLRVREAVGGVGGAA